VLLVAGRDGPEVLELVEEALDEVPVAAQVGLKAGTFTRLGIGLILAQAPCAVIVWRSASESYARSAMRIWPGPRFESMSAALLPS
jgi:hypothetical protein